MSLVASEQKIRISSPERVARLLEKVAQSRLPLLVRALSTPAIAVRGRAVQEAGVSRNQGFKIIDISDRGLKFLSENSAGGLMVEFALMSTKVEFFTSITELNTTGCTVSLPDCLMSIERRKNARFQVGGSSRAFLSMDSWLPDAEDIAAVPFFESSNELGPLILVGDISEGGVSLVTRFPSMCTVLGRSSIQETGKLYLPMANPIAFEAAIRWSKTVKDVLPDEKGVNRIIRLYRFGVQFVNPSAGLVNQIQMFIQKIGQAEAI